MAHLYDSRAGKIRWFVRRFGVRELLLKPVRMLLAPVILSRLSPGEFTFRGRHLSYFYHAYNTTWANERCVEIPVARARLEHHPARECLEVGNVLSHYGPVAHTVLDKYERGDGVINQDILEFQPGRRFQLIVSISTFEHIGFDDVTAGGGESRLLEAVEACIRWLHPDGRLVITIPVGYNPGLDRMIRSNELRPSNECYLHRTDRCQWAECSRQVAMEHAYGQPFPYANAILVAEFTPLNAESKTGRWTTDS